MRVLDLFSGIGGFSLGLERAGMKTVAFCEIDPYCRAVLRKHWPDIPIFEDVRTLTMGHTDDKIDIICGGFPCQDISLAGKGVGLNGERSSLWWEFHRLIAEARPRYAIIENVSALRSRGLDEVLGSLAALGYDAEWHCIPASAVGAPHRRDRIWIVAYPRDWKDGTAKSCKNVPINGLLGRAVHTPQARDGVSRGPSDPKRRVEQNHSVSLHDQIGGQLNPMWVEWLMGFPLGWTALKPSETPPSRRSRKLLGERS